MLESCIDADSIDGEITIQSFIPFDPTTKRTEVTYQDKSTSSTHRVTKGMPDAILRVCAHSPSDKSELSSQMRADENEFARRGFRSLAVAIADGDGAFRLIGLLSIFDPPREDTAETSKKAIDLGM